MIRKSLVGPIWSVIFKVPHGEFQVAPLGLAGRNLAGNISRWTRMETPAAIVYSASTCHYAPP